MTLDLLIPVYNQVETIEKTLQSALNQELKYNKIIVSDNCSNDGTSEILNRYSDHIVIVKPLNHLRMVENWNFLASHSSSDWISYCSGDDIVLKNHCLTLCRIINSNLRESFIAAGFNQINSISNNKKKRRLLSAHQYIPNNILHERLLSNPLASFSSFALRKHFFEDIGGYNEKYELNMDWIMQLKASKHSGIKRSHKIIASYHINSRPQINEPRKKAFAKDINLYVTKDLPFFSDYNPTLINRVIKILHQKSWLT